MSAGSIALPETEPEAGAKAATALNWSSVLRLLSLVLQMGLAILVIRAFQIEGPAFTRLALIVLGGFVLHAVLPAAWRHTVFLAVCVAVAVDFLGLKSGIWTIGLGAGLVLLATLPVRFGLRIALVLVAAGILAVFRSGLLPSGVPASVWPVLGSMFMFRMVVFFYDIRHGVETGPPARTLAYFFMVPNVAFPLFPVVDYKTFVRTQFDDDAWRIYQRGLSWIARGLVHLVVYRLIYHHLVMDLNEVRTGPQVVQYIFSSFMLYLRVSGMFHLAIGMLHLFGFRLPETNHFWLFCQSFTDLWRRMNIYTKDFLMKLVYYPSFFRLRKLGMKKGIALALVLVFIATWALHAVQWFWLRSEVLLSWQDALFYVILGALVIRQTLSEMKPGRKRTLETGPRRWSHRRALNALITMGLLMVLWSYWTADSVPQWLAMWSDIGTWPVRGTVIVLLSLLGFLGLAGLPWRAPELADKKDTGILRSALFTTGSLCGLLVLGQPSLMQKTSGRLAEFMKPVQENTLNRRDNAALLRGYYEKVDNGARLGTQVWQAEQNRPEDWDRITSTAIYHQRDDFMGGELVPEARTVFKDEEFLTSRWAMHDQDYEKLKPAGAFRIGFLGPSDVMGPGVKVDHTFEALVETRLNQEHAGGRYQKYEILNFGVAAYTMLQQAVMLEDRVFDFQPDVVMVTYHPLTEAPTSLRYVVDYVRAGKTIPYPELQDIVRKANFDSTTKDAVAKRRMYPYADDLLRWSLREIARACQEHKIPAVLLVMDALIQESPAEQPLLRYADSLGFTLVDIRGATRGRDPFKLILAEWDRHPNELGHQLLADAMYARLVALDDSLGLGLKK